MPEKDAYLESHGYNNEDYARLLTEHPYDFPCHRFKGKCAWGQKHCNFFTPDTSACTSPEISAVKTPITEGKTIGNWKTYGHKDVIKDVIDIKDIKSK